MDLGAQAFRLQQRCTEGGQVSVGGQALLFSQNHEASAGWERTGHSGSRWTL